MSLINFIVVIIINALPYDSMAKMNLSLVLTQLLEKLFEYLQKNDYLNPTFIRRLYRYNTVTLPSQHYHFYALVEYYYKKYNPIIKEADSIMRHGERKLMIKTLTQNSIEDQDESRNTIYIQIKKLGEIKEDEVMIGSYQMVLTSTASVDIINQYLSIRLKACSVTNDREFRIYNIDVEKGDKHKKMSWISHLSISNKTEENVIVSSKIKRDFYNDMEKFWNSEESYNKRGITFKRGYLIWGIPGSGKSAIISSIVYKYQLPIFRFDMSIIKENEDLLKLNDSIYDQIGLSERHLVLMEDIDRCDLFCRRYNSAITMDSLLNMLDGVGGAYARITIMTANDIRDLQNVEGLLRPGRIDRIIELSNCTDDQIRGIIALNFDKKPEEVKIKEGIKINPANLNKIIQILDDFDKVIDCLNTKEIDEDTLENLYEIKIDSPESPDSKKSSKSKGVWKNGVYQVQPGRRARNKSKNTRGGRRYIPNKKKTDKPHGLTMLENLDKKIEKEEIQLEHDLDNKTIDYKIRVLQLEKLKKERDEKKILFQKKQEWLAKNPPPKDSDSEESQESEKSDDEKTHPPKLRSECDQDDDIDDKNPDNETQESLETLETSIKIIGNDNSAIHDEDVD